MAATEYDWNTTRNALVSRAFRTVGVLSLGETLSGEQIAQGVELLNSIVKNWQSQRIYLWTLKPFTLALSTTLPYTALPTDPAVMTIDKAFIRDDQNEDEALEVLSWRKYLDITDKETSRGKPILCAIDDQIIPKLYVYPFPSEATNLYALGVVKLKDADTAGGNLDFPVRWIEPLHWELAFALSFEYGLPGSSQDRIEKRAKETFAIARSSDTEHADYEFVDGAF